MARVQLVISDEELDRFVKQARTESLTLSAWLRAAARERLEDRQRLEPFQSSVDLEKFFVACDALEGPKVEPEWDKHLSAITASRRRIPPSSSGRRRNEKNTW